MKKCTRHYACAHVQAKTTKPMVEWGQELHLEGCTRPELTQLDGRLPSMLDDPRWKTTLDGRQPSMEDNFRWKTTVDERQPLMEDNLRWKTTFYGRRHSMEDDL